MPESGSKSEFGSAVKNTTGTVGADSKTYVRTNSSPGNIPAANEAQRIVVVASTVNTVATLDSAVGTKPPFSQRTFAPSEKTMAKGVA